MYDDITDWDQVRKRNLRISIAKGIISKDWGDYEFFSEDEVRDIFRFKVGDLAHYSKDFFKLSDGKYMLEEQEKQYIVRILKAHNTVMEYVDDADAKFVAEFGSFHDEYEKSNRMNFSYSRYQIAAEKVRELLPILHWGHLPIFNKYLLYNRRVNPEKSILEFYDHYDCLKAMLNEIRGKGEVMQIESDKTLGKEMTFDVYTRRWGHLDRYHIKRTIDGWECLYLSPEEKCEKSGKGSLFNNLSHDSVFFPEEGVQYAMEELWEAAEEGEIDLEELQKRLQQIADWISHVEKAVGEKQPEWVNYY